MKDIIKETRKYWDNQINCSRSTASGILDYYNFPNHSDTLFKALIPFGGGIGERSVCGAVTGSLAALSTILFERGFSEEEITEKTKEFKERFKREMGTLYCREILKDFISTDGTLDKDNPERRKLCDKAVDISVKIVKDIIET
jgi:C_GCAxxG_C_C family probable redox protein